MPTMQGHRHAGRAAGLRAGRHLAGRCRVTATTTPRTAQAAATARAWVPHPVDAAGAAFC